VQSPTHAQFFHDDDSTLRFATPYVLVGPIAIYEYTP
jgi:hypothetical protein